MEYYEDERRQYRPAKERSRRDSYDDDSAYTARDQVRSSALVRRRDSYDSVEDIPREFSPGGGGYIRETTIRRAGIRPARGRSYDDERYDDRSYYDERSYDGRRGSGRYGDDQHHHRSRRHSSDYSSRSRSRTPPRKDRDRRKSKTDEALGALGLGGLAATLLGRKEGSRSNSRDRSTRHRAHSEDRHSSSRRSKSKGPSKEQLTQAVKAAILAGAGEAFRARKDKGAWTGEKGRRIVTAAIAAGGLDGLVSHARGEDQHKKRNVVGSAIAGVATSRLINGPRSKSRGRAGSRSPGSPGSRRRSKSRTGLGDLAAGGVVAAAAKKAYDAVRGRSTEPDRDRGRRSSRSLSDRDSRSRSRTSRRRSLSRGLAKGLSAVGMNKAADRVDPERRKSDRYDHEYDGGPGGYRFDERNGDYYRDDDVGQPRLGPSSDNARAKSPGQSHDDWHVANIRHSMTSPSGYSLDFTPHHNGDPDTDSDSDLGSSSGEEKDRSKSKRKLILTSGLATIATIHAGHSIYQSYEKRHSRHKALREGTISPEQAKENRNKDRMQDAASIGVAALGIKGAYSEWKETHESRMENKEVIETTKRHAAKRAARRAKYENLQHQIASRHDNGTPDLHAPVPVTNYGPPFASGGAPYYPPNQYGASPGPYYDGHNDYPSFNQQGLHYYDAHPPATDANSPSYMPGPPMPPPDQLNRGFNFMSPPPYPNGQQRAVSVSPQPSPMNGQHPPRALSAGPEARNGPTR